MSIDIQAATYSSKAEMQAAHKARQRRFAAAARGVPQPRDTIKRKAADVLPPQQFCVPEVKPVLFDEHVKAYHRWRDDEVYREHERFVREEAERMGVTYAEIVSDDRSPTVCAVRVEIALRLRDERHVDYPTTGILLRRSGTTIRHLVVKLERKKRAVEVEEGR